MDSKKSLHSLATIDFSEIELIPGSAGWNSVKLQAKEALEEYGCFQVVYDKVPMELHKKMYSSLEELFDLPLATKTQNTTSKALNGYFGQYPSIPLYESVGIDDPANLEGAESFTLTMWPQGNPSFCKTVHSFSKQVAELDHVIRRMVLEWLGIEKYLDEHLNSTHYVFRVMKYDAPKIDDDTHHEVGLSAHRDKNFVTILSQNPVQGLQVQTKDDHGQWIDLEVMPNAFVVLVGCSFHAWTNGRLHPPIHRVRMTGNEARYSTGLFSIPKPGHLVKAPEELVDEHHPLLFKPYDFYEILGLLYVAEAYGADPLATLKTYCGV